MRALNYATLIGSSISVMAKKFKCFGYSPKNFALGCGSLPNGSTTVENYRTTRPVTGGCLCYDGFGVQCYAICGQI